jgi:hypothetical protein
MRPAPPRATARAASIALAIALAPQPGCGVAQRTARGAAEAAIGTLARKAGDHERFSSLTEGLKRRAAVAAVDELSRPEHLGAIQRIAAAMAGGTVSGASKAATPAEAIAERAARAFSRQLVAELGPSGEGPLGTSLSALTERLTASMARGARGHLTPLFPECSGADASGCLDRTVERMSRAGTAGVAAGVRESLGIWPLVLAFGGGVISTIALAWARGIHRAGTSSSRDR